MVLGPIAKQEVLGSALTTPPQGHLHGLCPIIAWCMWDGGTACLHVPKGISWVQNKKENNFRSSNAIKTCHRDGGAKMNP